MAKLSSIRGMQDAREKDMFHLSNSNYLRYNGHVQISSSAKSGGGKKERKGCTKGKIEAVMRNSSFSPSIISSAQANMTVTAVTNSHGNHFLRANHVPKVALEQDDPYTFTETEPQVPSQYPGPSAVIKKPIVVKVAPPASVATQAKADVPSYPRTSVTPKHNPKPPLDTLSKMNKLQAEFARNKVMGKRRKVDQIPTPVINSKWEPGIVRKRENNRVVISSRKIPRKTTWQRERKARHELLERIEEAKNDWEMLTQDIYPLGLEVSDSDDESENCESIYGRHWFHVGGGKGESREGRVARTRTVLRRELHQVMQGVTVAESPPTDLLSAVISAARSFPNATALLLDPNPSPLTPAARYVNKISKGGRFLLRGEKCSHWEGCNQQSLPCTRHCADHIMTNVDQRLFSRCTAKAPDNTQCNVPVFDVLHEVPLCPLHASKHENLKMMLAEVKQNKKVNKKSRMLGLSRSNKRNQKKRKKGVSGSGTEEAEPSSSMSHVAQEPAVEVHSGTDRMPMHIADPQPAALPIPPPQLIVPPPQPADIVAPILSVPPTHHPAAHLVEVSEEVLAIAALDPVELATQATRLLEEHDLTNVLNQISPDDLNDLFAEDKNAGYEPTREETEELDRALEAVDNDVRSLEELTRGNSRSSWSDPSLPSLLPLVDSFLEDHSLAVFPPPPPFPTDIQPS